MDSPLRGGEPSGALYRPVRIGTLLVPGNLFLAPVAGYSDAAFRSICAARGADLTCTELVSAEALVRKNPAAGRLLLRSVEEKIFVIQLFGSDPETLAKAAGALSPYHPDVVDINCGCPVPKVVKTGAGSALLKDPPRLGKIVEAVVKLSAERLSAAPVTVKIRLGWDSSSINYRETARVAEEAGASAIALHGRTRAQNYSGLADWDAVADLVSRTSLPVFGSGDLFTPEDAQRRLRESACAAVMFARGAMGNPFIFSETKALLRDGAYEATPFETKLAVGLRQLRLSANNVGEKVACREMRKHFCAYTKGVVGGAVLRSRLMSAETLEEYSAIIEPIISEKPPQ